MKRLLVLLLFHFFSLIVSGQMPADPATWTFSIENKSATEATLVFTVHFEKGWHMYSQFTEDGGPLPAYFALDSSTCYQKIDGVTEPVPVSEFDSLFGVTVKYFVEEATFRQKIRLSDPTCMIKGKIDYQACKEACIFYSKEFQFAFEK
ncbi:MAG TPA: protein-disulfide reductase DsbD family protein [Bacteroidia bacterium]|nr:protein-disulfide reductase DsbD family protein [Bacteroidia bacterium]